MEPVHNHVEVYGAGLIEVDDTGIEAADALAAMAVNGQPPAATTDDDDPEFQRQMQMAIALSVQESCFDMFLRDEDERRLSVGVEQSIAAADAIRNVARDLQRQKWRESAKRKR